MSDLVSAAWRVVAKKGYTGEILENLRAAIGNRLGTLCTGSIGAIFNVGISSPTIEQLTHGYYLIELDALQESQIALLTQFYLKALREYLSSTPVGRRYLRLAIIIDELHVIAGRDKDAVPFEGAINPKVFAAQKLCKLLMEFRKRYVGLVMADQSPFGIPEDVMRAAGSKLARRIVHEADRKEIGGAMLFTDYELEQIAGLLPGQAFFFTEGYHKSRLIQTVNLTEMMDFSATPTSDELHELICDQPWYREARLVFETARLARLDEEMARMDAERNDIAVQTVKLLTLYTERTKRHEDPSELAAYAKQLRDRLDEMVQEFRQGPYRQLLGRDEPSDPEGVRNVRAELRERFEVTITADTQACIKVLDDLVKGAETRI
jgi:hypothetical protein